MYSLCNFHKNNFCVCSTGLLTAANPTRFPPFPCLNSIKRHISGRSTAISLPYSLSNWQCFSDGKEGTEIKPGTPGMYQVTGTTSREP